MIRICKINRSGATSGFYVSLRIKLVILVMRLLILLFFLLPIFANGQSDTVDLSEIGKPLVGKSHLAILLLERPYWSMNFLHANTFRYKLLPFNGVAKGIRKDHGYVVVNFVNGKIVHLERYYSTRYAGLVYKYDRLDGDTLAVDSSFNIDGNRDCVSSTILFRRDGHLRQETKQRGGYVFNHYVIEDSGDKYGTWNGFDYITVTDGYQKLWYKTGYKAGYVRNDTMISPWRVYDQGGHLRAVYEVNGAKYRHDAYNGKYTEYWPNGEIGGVGYFKNDAKTGHWKYFDSTGVFCREEWYSYELGESNLDSIRTYFPDSVLQLFEKRIFIETRQYDDDDSSQYDIERHYQYLRMECYYNGRKKSMQQRGCHEIDTLLACWYINGQLSKIELSNRDSREYYSNGQMRSSGVPYVKMGARHGDVKEFDSTGLVLIDRSYVDGKVVTIRDTNGWKKDEERIRIGDSLAGAAVIGCFPRSGATTGINQHWLNYGKSNIPSWKDSIFIPSQVLDSLSYAVAGAFLKFPDSLRNKRDSIFQYASEFHPAQNEWIYTVSMGIPDTGTWISNCETGKLWTRNPIVDQYFEKSGYDIISWDVLGNPYGQVWDSGRYVAHYWCRAVISVQHPLNFIYFMKLDTKGYNAVHLECGDGTDYKYEYRLARLYRKDRNNYREDQECTDENYLSFNVLHKNYWYSRTTYEYFFIINSDAQADLKFMKSEYSHYWYGKDNLYYLGK